MLEKKAITALVSLYRGTTGHTTIPQGQKFWFASDNERSFDVINMVQLVSAGFIEKEQFFEIEGNRSEFNDDNLAKFSPAIVFLNQTDSAFRKKDFATELAKIMNICEKGTLVFANFKDSRAFDLTRFLVNHNDLLSEPGSWKMFHYASSNKVGRAKMTMVAFHRSDNHQEMYNSLSDVLSKQ